MCAYGTFIDLMMITDIEFVNACNWHAKVLPGRLNPTLSQIQANVLDLLVDPKILVCPIEAN